MIKHHLRRAARGGQVMAGSATARNSLVLFGGNLISSVLALIAVIFISRALGPERFGVLATFNAVTASLIGITNFGLDTAAIKIISSHLATDRRKAAVVMKVIFNLELLSGVIIGVAGLLFSRHIAILLGGTHLLFAVRLAFFSSAFASATAFVGPFFVAHQQFTRNAIFGAASSVVRTAAILLLAIAASLSITNVLWVYTAVPIIFFFVGVLIAPKEWRLKATRAEQKVAATEVFHLSKWILLAYVATVIAGKLDVFLISRLRGTTAVGLYSAGQQLSSAMPLLIGAISTAILPKFSQFAQNGQLKRNYKRAAVGTFALAVCMLPAVFISGPLIHLVFGHKYTAAIPVFRILFVAYLIALPGNVLSLALYALNQPRILTYMNYVGLASTIIIYPIMISRFGIQGAAWAFLINTIIGTVPSIYFSYKATWKHEA
jgi:O-antigen/teichoic acid export membrane protein